MNTLLTYPSVQSNIPTLSASKPIMLAICGGPSSNKRIAAEQIRDLLLCDAKEAMKKKILIVPMSSFYREFTDLELQDLERLNLDLLAEKLSLGVVLMRVEGMISEDSGIAEVMK